MKVAVFHPGTQHSWQTALALQQLGRLAWYATSIFYQPDRLPYRLERWAPTPLARRMKNEFSRFNRPGLDLSLVRTAGLAEWAERIVARTGLHPLAQRIDRWGNRRFVRQLSADISSPEKFALWGYNGSSAESFALARDHQRLSILDRTVGDYRAYNEAMAPLRESYAEWFTGAEPVANAALIEQDDREYALADAIVCGCDYAAQTIARHSPVAGVAGKLYTLPYCYDEQLFAAIPSPAPQPSEGPVRFLFVGHLSMRKGVHHALEAIAALPASQATLTLVGAMAIPRSVFARYSDRVDYRATVPRADMPAIMAAHDVLIFPSYFEGSAISLLEALAAGLAIIQAPQAGNGATDKCGIVIDRPDTDLLIAAMAACIADRDKLFEWRTAAQDEARRYSFASYRDNIAALLARLDPAASGRARD